MENSKIKWTVDVEGLAIALAENSWMIDTKNENTNDLYDISAFVDVVRPMDIRVMKKVRPVWQSSFGALKNGYLKLIEDFKT